MVYDFVGPDSVPVVQAYMSTDVCGDDRFSPGVTNCASLKKRNALDSHGKNPWECMSVSVDSSVTCLSDCWSVLRFVALLSGSPEFPDVWIYHDGTQNARWCSRPHHDMDEMGITYIILTH